MPNTPRDQVFVSYSHDDKNWLAKLMVHLKALEQYKAVDIWWDGKIKPGQKWRNQIKQALASARVAVLLVSPGFLASEFILEEELPEILRDAAKEGTAILWCLVSYCNYGVTEIAEYQAAHDLEKVWVGLSESELDALFTEISRSIQEAFKSPAPPPPQRQQPREPEEPARPSADSRKAEGIYLAGT